MYRIYIYESAMGYRAIKKSPTEMRFSGAFSFTYFIAKHITKFGFVYV